MQAMASEVENCPESCLRVNKYTLRVIRSFVAKIKKLFFTKREMQRKN